MALIFNIKEKRQARGMTQAQLAASLNLKSPSTITMWENGDRHPPSSILPKLAEVLGCTIDQLYRREPPERRPSSNQNSA